jgi:hypothetical protein
LLASDGEVSLLIMPGFDVELDLARAARFGEVAELGILFKAVPASPNSPAVEWILLTLLTRETPTPALGRVIR